MSHAQLQIGFARAEAAHTPAARRSGPGSGVLFVAVGDPALGEIVGGHFDRYAIAGQNTNSISSQFTGKVRQHNAFLIKLDAEEAAREFFHDGPSHLDTIFLAHLPPNG
jgi:hypothetical protein